MWFLVLGVGVPDPILVVNDLDDLRLNQIQVIGSHNSYHVAPSPGVLKVIAALRPGQAESLDYTHRPLAEQFEDLGIRQIELDIFADPEGGLFSRPMARASLIAQGGDPGPDPNRDGLLDEPGPKVLHFQDIDYGTTTPTLAVALAQVRDWSRTHPDHVPILVLLELKDGEIPGLTRPAPMDSVAIEAVESVIRSTFDPDHLLTPDDIRGDCATLPEAIQGQGPGRGWPRLGDVRGRVFFALDNGGRVRDLYLEGHPALKGRAMFADAGSTDHPAAAWFKRNDPIGQFDDIQNLVRQGFLVRTRADAGTKQARTGDTNQRDRAFDSGAQFISTDYPEPDSRFTSYQVTLPGGAEAVANPLSAEDR